MKISKNQLRKIIKEELYRVLQEVDPRGAGREGPYARRPDKYGKFSGGKRPIDDPYNDWKNDEVTLGPGGPKFGGWKRPDPEPEPEDTTVEVDELIAEEELYKLIDNTTLADYEKDRLKDLLRESLIETAKLWGISVKEFYEEMKDSIGGAVGIKGTIGSGVRNRYLQAETLDGRKWMEWEKTPDGKKYAKIKQKYGFPHPSTDQQWIDDGAGYGGNIPDSNRSEYKGEYKRIIWGWHFAERGLVRP